MKAPNTSLSIRRGTCLQVHLVVTVCGCFPGEPQTVDLVAGRQTYVEACVFCHGDQGEGGQDGIPLDGAISAAANRTTITNGRNSMPSFGNLLTSRQIQDVAAYLAEGFDR